MQQPLVLRVWAVWALGVYAVVVGVIVLSPVSYKAIISTVADWGRTALGFSYFGAGWVEFCANILMFLPLGFLLTAALRRPGWGVFIALVISGGVEIVQIVIPSRQPSVRDVLANLLGAAIGASLAWFFVVRHEKGPRAATRLSR